MQQLGHKTFKNNEAANTIEETTTTSSGEDKTGSVEFRFQTVEGTTTEVTSGKGKGGTKVKVTSRIPSKDHATELAASPDPQEVHHLWTRRSLGQ